MSWYRDLKIRNKLLAGYALVVALSGIIAFYGINGMKEIKSLLDVTHDHLIASIIMASDADHHAQQHKREFLRYLGTAESRDRQEILARLKREEDQMKDALSRLKTVQIHDDEKQLLASIALAWDTYREEAALAVAAASTGRRQDAWVMLNLQVAPLFKELEDEIRKLRSTNAGESDRHYHDGAQTYSRLRVWMSGLSIALISLALVIVVIITRSVAVPLRSALDMVGALAKGGEEKARLAEAIAKGDLSRTVAPGKPLSIDPRSFTADESGELLRAVAAMSETQGVLDKAFAGMTDSLRESREIETGRDWSKTGLNELNTIMRGEQKARDMADKVLTFLANYLNAGAAAFYIYDETTSELVLSATHAFTRRKNLGDRFRLGEGVLGQAGREKKMICLSNVPADYLPIASALGESVPRNIVAVPLLHNGKLAGALELATFAPFSDIELEFLNQAVEGIAVGLGVADSRQKINELLEQTQQQTEELRVQQEELQQTNEELEERAELLEQQQKQIEEKNEDLAAASEEIRRKAAEVERVSAYKSEFLANMSHELRTPLNSIMILSSLLIENREGILSGKQREFAETINSSGKDLLNLINDILDLSKVEAGKMDLHYEDTPVEAFSRAIGSMFRQQAEHKGLDFMVTVEPGAPETIRIDEQRTQQILKNLISNAVKFTEKGSVSLNISAAAGDSNPLRKPAVLFAVADTGIGIPREKQGLVFQAFQQADGSTSRRFGGTGLGLSISLQLARKMGGDITLTSEPGKGSVFTLALPLSVAPSTGTVPLREAAAPEPRIRTAGPDRTALVTIPQPLPDDRETLKQSERSILVIEDDLNFARTLMTLVREKGFGCLVAAEGTSGLHLADSFEPSAILLDVMLPGMDGWAVMRSLKDNPRTRHIPVHFITCLDDRQRAMAMGAVGFITKPVTPQQLDDVFTSVEAAIEKTIRKLLIVEDDAVEAQSMRGLLQDRNLAITVAATGKAAVETLSREQIDCIVLDLGLSDMSGFDLLDHIHGNDQHRNIPVIIHTGRDLTHEEELKLQRYARSIIIKGAKSPERLLNEVTLFLHMVESDLPQEKQRMIRAAMDREAMLDNKKVLLVDDDMRNVFSLSSVLADKNMKVIEAENGKEALTRLTEHPDVNIALMDIMMPEMDGYDAIRAIRRDPRFKDLPIIAMTAKALKGDQEKCLQAGANDYIAKPLDVEKLLSLLRVWLYPRV